MIYEFAIGAKKPSLLQPPPHIQSLITLNLQKINPPCCSLCNPAKKIHDSPNLTQLKWFNVYTQPKTLTISNQPKTALENQIKLNNLTLYGDHKQTIFNITYILKPIQTNKAK